MENKIRISRISKTARRNSKEPLIKPVPSGGDGLKMDHKVLYIVVHLIKRKLVRKTDWLTKSELKVNEAKTELCLFFKNGTAPIGIQLNGKLVNSKPNINVLGVFYGSQNHS